MTTVTAPAPTPVAAPAEIPAAPTPPPTPAGPPALPTPAAVARAYRLGIESLEHALALEASARTAIASLKDLLDTREAAAWLATKEDGSPAVDGKNVEIRQAQFAQLLNADETYSSSRVDLLDMESGLREAQAKAEVARERIHLHRELLRLHQTAGAAVTDRGFVLRSVTYGRVKGLPNYSSERLEVTADVLDGDVSTAMDEAADFVAEQLGVPRRQAPPSRRLTDFGPTPADLASAGFTDLKEHTL